MSKYAIFGGSDSSTDKDSDLLGCENVLSSELVFDV